MDIKNLQQLQQKISFDFVVCAAVPFQEHHECELSTEDSKLNKVYINACDETIWPCCLSYIA